MQQTIQCLRVLFQESDAEYLYVTSDAYAKGVRLNLVKENLVQDFSSTLSLLWPQAVMHLLDVKAEKTRITARFLVLEPNYLVDISALAEAYKDYGATSTNYLLQRMMRISNVVPLLLGNFANLFLDEWIHTEKELSYVEVMQKAFQQYALELATCQGLQCPQQEKQFFADCRRHFLNIRQMVFTMKAQQNLPFKIDDAVLEPSYICTSLGIQGRLDYMQRDRSAFIEMKSGKADEYTRRGSLLPKENNRIQMLLYMAVLQFSRQQKAQEQHPYLFYSRYPWLYAGKVDWTTVKDVINLRNQIVAHDHSSQQEKEGFYLEQFYEQLSVEDLNTKGMTGKLWNVYQKPQLERFLSSLHHLNPLEKNYFYTLKAFVTRELYLSKVGSGGEQCTQHSAALWTAPFEQKSKEGDILYDLRLAENDAACQKAPSLLFQLPSYPVDFMPNFRQGDIVVLYERNEETDNVSHKMIFKGAIEWLNSTQLKIRLRAVQANTAVLPKQSSYAVEHDFTDASFQLMYKGLYQWAIANSDRRHLLLGTRLPVVNPQYKQQIADAADDFERIAYKALSANDYFLLVGPPGTGKTSMALKRIVEVHVKEQKSQLLLLSYTNRAVDEICKSLSTLDPPIPFIRLGNELTCADAYRECLLERHISEATSRNEVRECLLEHQIFVGTVAYVSNKSSLFELKRFDAAIIDEATQILEPQLLGLLSAKDGEGRNAIDKFIMIGDHKQLPAVVLQDRSETVITIPELQQLELNNLSDSLFERLYRLALSCGDKRIYDMLDKQGRMHPEVAKYANNFFYKGQLGVVGLSHQQQEKYIKEEAAFPWTNLLQHRVAFLDVPSSHSASIKNNAAEARIISELVFAIYDRNRTAFNPEKTLGVITPYRSQIALIRGEIAKLDTPILNEIVIDSVERYQGSERDCILYSFCLNEVTQLSLLSACVEQEGILVDRKLNVALTRAREQMILIGNAKLLSHSSLFSHLMHEMPCFVKEKRGEIEKIDLKKC